MYRRRWKCGDLSGLLQDGVEEGSQRSVWSGSKKVAAQGVNIVAKLMNVAMCDPGSSLGLLVVQQFGLAISMSDCDLEGPVKRRSTYSDRWMGLGGG